MQIATVVSQAVLLSITFNLLVWPMGSYRDRRKRIRWTTGSEATSPSQQEEEGTHPSPEDDLAHKSYILLGAVIKQD